MKVAVSITKVFEVGFKGDGVVDLASLQRQCEREDFDKNGIDWYDIEKCDEIWSYAIVSEQ